VHRIPVVDRRPSSAPTARYFEGLALADRYTACWGHFNQKHWDQFAKCYDANTPSMTPGLPPAKGGKAIIELHAKPIAAAIPDVAETSSSCW
jgi:hypothetical protein